MGTDAPGRALARLLASRGVFTDPRWHRAVLATDRARFIPPVLYGPDPAHPGWECPVTSADPRWAEWVSGDYALATQVDDGNPTGSEGRGRTPTSSISQPSLVVDMLQHLDATEGQRVLEIGTGSGYNTALLCHALSDSAVVSTEVDPALAATAVANLADAGYRPTVLDQDGAALLERKAGMFHRVLATVAARQSIPYSWVSQVHPGGVVVTPWEVGNQPGVLVRLTVGEDGAAHGRIVGDAPFMVLRSQRPDPRRVRDLVDEDAPGKSTGHTAVNPRLVAYRHQGWQLTLGHLVPDVRYAVYEAAQDRPEWAGEATVYVATPDGSWALAEYTPFGGLYETEHAGPRDLWAQIGQAWQVWEQFGRPDRGRLGVTVDEEGTRLWVDEPSRPLCLPAPALRP
ncbi:rRNA adenine N-6-methyltransferase family protein [Nocardiopsis sp. LOL_012]|uniref:rRNA adenine N-6-methyltransferase family protein n=1 Tax=Nocardiopsis sp. LOL_012 TaxID=3345409 RepID=UPI003A868DDB